MSMNNENNINKQDILKNIKVQNELIKLIQVLDNCMENMDNFYCYAMKKQFLATSNNN